jgi:hypothetical protein
MKFYEQFEIKQESIFMALSKMTLIMDQQGWKWDTINILIFGYSLNLQIFRIIPIFNPVDP